MELLVIIAMYSSFFDVNNFDGMTRNDAYCQNLYWQPYALEQMHMAGCDFAAVEAEINLVKSGRSE